MIGIKPTKILRVTWGEIVSHKDDIPDEAIVEVQVFDPAKNGTTKANGEGSFDGKSLYNMLAEIGFVNDVPEDLSEKANEYFAASDFGETISVRDVK